jgi:prophage antirepressor-like protein
MTLIAELDLWSLAMKSKLTSLEEFTNRVYGDVISSIR